MSQQSLDQLTANLLHARQLTAHHIEDALHTLQTNQQPIKAKIEQINAKIQSLSKSRPKTNKQKIKKTKDIQKLKNQRPKLQKTSMDIKYYNNVLRIQSTSQFIDLYYNKRLYVIDELTPYIDDNSSVTHTIDNIFYQPASAILDPGFVISIPSSSHMRIQFITVLRFQLDYDEVNNYTLSPSLTSYISQFAQPQDLPAFYAKQKAAFYTSRLAHYAINHDMKTAKKKAKHELQLWSTDNPPTMDTYICQLDTFYTTTIPTQAEHQSNPDRSLQDHIKYRIINFLDKRSSPDIRAPPMLICIESITSQGQPAPVITPNQIQGATNDDIHCINAILQQYNKPLLPLTPGVPISVEALQLLIKKSKNYRFNIHNRLSALLDLEPLFIIGGANSKQIDITHQFMHFTARKLSLLKSKQIDHIIYTSTITPHPDAIDLIKDGTKLVAQYILEDNKLNLYKTYNPNPDDPTSLDHSLFATVFTRNQHIFKKFITDNRIRPSQFDLPQAADYHPLRHRFRKPRLDEQVYEYDLNNAYPRLFSPDHLYPSHTLIVQNSSVYSPNIAFVINPRIDHHDKNILSIYNSYYRSPVIAKPLLDFLIANAFTIQYSQVIITTKHRALPTTFDYCKTKLEKTTILGKLIQKQSSRIKVFPECTLSEYQSLQHTAAKHNIPAHPYEWNAPENALQDLHVELPKNKKTYAYIHATMLGYHHVNMLTALFQFNLHEIVEVFVDAIFLSKPLDISINPLFKAVAKSKSWHANLQAVGYPSDWRAKPEPLVPFTLPSQPFPITSRVMAISGPAGSGKSYAWLDFLQNTDDAMLLTPTVQLRHAHRQNLPPGHENKIQTAAKVFQFSMSEIQYNLTQNKRPAHQSIYIIDEFTMFSSNEFNQILRRCDSFIILLGDINQISKSIDSAPIMTHPEFPPIKEHIPSGQRRQQDPEFINFLDTIRTLTYSQIIQHINKTNWNRGISSELQHILADNHKALAPFNAEHLKSSPLVQIRSKKDKKIIQLTQQEIKKLPKNKKPVILQESRNKPNPYEVAFGCTVDSFQGSTLSKPYGIILSDMQRQGALYTALSRAQSKHLIWLL